MQTQTLIAERTARMSVNAIREILKVVAQPGMISLAGGMPAPESFPMEIIRELTRQVIDTYGSTAFQYGPTEGFAPLRHHLAEHLKKKKGFQVTPENVFISNGSALPESGQEKRRVRTWKILFCRFTKGDGNHATQFYHDR
jgi:2-aminoadipate transaminase